MRWDAIGALPATLAGGRAGWRERPPDRFRELLGRSGWKLQRVIPTVGGAQTVEATAVD